MEPIKNNDNEKIEEIKNIEKNGMRELSDEELEGVAGGIVDGKNYAPEIYDIDNDDWT